MTSIIGVGTDLEEVRRFIKYSYSENKPFYRKIFTEDEISSCLKKANPSQSFTARFAAKESIMKCSPQALFFTDIIIENDKNGVPRARIKKLPGVTTHLSLSHTQEYGVAFAVLTKNATNK